VKNNFMVDINLIPREYREKKEKLKTIFSKTGGVVLILVILSLLFYGGLLLYQNKLKKNLNDIKNETLVLDSKRDLKTEKAMIDLDKKISVLKSLFENHFYWSDLFKKVGELTVPEVYFSNAKFGILTGGIELAVGGGTTTYTNLARQILSFQEDSSVEEVQVSGIALGEKGIRFNLIIIFSKDILFKKTP
jgi:hypothetical protein